MFGFYACMYLHMHILMCTCAHKHTSNQTRIYLLASLFLLFCVHLSQIGLLNTPVSTSKLQKIKNLCFSNADKIPNGLDLLKYSAEENK